jgi:hypothetical protein
MTIRTACALALVSSVALAAAPVAAAAKPPPKPGRLWNQFPLGTQQLTGKTPTLPARTPTVPTGVIGRPETTATTPSRPSGLSASLLVALGAAVLLLGVAALVVVRVYPRQDGPLTEEEFTTSLSTIEDAAARLESRRQARGFEAQPFTWHNFTSTQERGTGMTDQLAEGVETPTPDSKEASQSHAAVADRVAAVITAAEEVAAQVRADALEEAAAIKQQAEEAAVNAIRRAAKERDEMRATSEADAETMRIESEKYASGRRSEAEAEAASLLAEGEAQARALREAAEQMAQRIEASALRRRDEIEEGSRGAEAKLRRFQLGVASISEDLDGLLEPQEGQAVTLTEALVVDVANTPRQ